MHYVDVAPTRIVRATADRFTYHTETPLAIGTIVTIPVGKTQAVGVVVAPTKRPAFPTKPITTIVEATPLPASLLRVAFWMSSYYQTPLATVLSSLLPTGLTKKRRRQPSPKQATIRQHAPLIPTADQQQSIEAIIHSDSTTQLLYGVTGSGKTLVYIETARYFFTKGKSSIILVPEIALTSQLVDEFRQFFHDDVVVIHSKQTEAERHTIWHYCLTSKTPKIVIGPRSALFAPLHSVGLIVIDEFHEPTYKQEQAPRYHATRVATMLARYHRGTVLLGSATPPVSDYFAALKAGVPVHRLSLRAVATAKKPRVQLVDMTKKNNFSRHRFLSNQLLDSIETALNEGRQSLIFHNRRGTAAITLCNACGWSAIDPATNLPLTLHADQHILISHISGYQQPVPTSCPHCGGVDIVHKGIGTKLLETELTKLFPNKKIIRFDGDTSDNNTVDQRYDDLYSGRIDIIIGTQVVAKGLDLPHLHTVGVIQADTGLVLPDYTANERAFQLLAQVIGRVGRTQQTTEVIVQSYQPNHSAIAKGIKQDFMGFYEQAIKERSQQQFPPFVYLLKLTCVYKTEAAVIKNSRALLAALKKDFPTATFLGPAPAFYEKQHGTYRWQIIVKSKSRAVLQSIITRTPATHWQYELDPVSLL